MLKIAITGGIGTGKTSVCKEFEKLGVPVYYADIQAKKLMHQNPIKEQLIKTFGNDAFKNNQLNRSYLASIVFKNNKLLEKLNNIVHPAVAQDYQKWLSQKKQFKYTIKEAAIIFEINAQSEYDKIILVYADDEIRIERAMKRDNVSRAQIEARIQKQNPQNENLNKADYVITNHNWDETKKQILNIHLELTHTSDLQ